MELRFLYVGTSDVDADLDAWTALAGSGPRWRFRHFGADVAAVDPGEGPLVLLADHRPAGSVLPIYAVDDLDAAMRRATDVGWRVAGGPMGTPEGDAVVLEGPGGASIALLQVDRPGAMDGAYADEANTHAVRD